MSEWTSANEARRDWQYVLDQAASEREGVRERGLLAPMPLAETDACCGQLHGSDFHLRPPCENCPLIEPAPANLTPADFVMLTPLDLMRRMGMVPLIIASHPCAGHSVPFGKPLTERREHPHVMRAARAL